ncbi:MAG: hypothetical protein JRI51_08225 [Deltaproteobacteria bacterium]|nr:hypothetical protein [Deltaproteobacteria bacterium]
MELLNKINRVINDVFMCVAGIVLAAMIILTCANIFCRLVWLPIRGTFELMGYFGAVITAFALGFQGAKYIKCYKLCPLYCLFCASGVADMEICHQFVEDW